MVLSSFSPPAAAWVRVAHMTVTPQLFVTVAKLSSEACWSIVSMHLGGYAVLYRPGIDGGGAEIPATRHIGALATPVTAVPVKDISGTKWCHSARWRPTRVIQSTSGSPWDLVMGWVCSVWLVQALWGRFRAARKRGTVVWTGGWYILYIRGRIFDMHL